jgi:hypothetical protein
MRNDGKPGGASDGDHPDQSRVQSRYQRCQKAASQGPVFITDRGRPAHVLLTMADYLRLTGGHMSLAEALAQPGEEFDFDPLRVGSGIFKPADLG